MTPEAGLWISGWMLLSAAAFVAGMTYGVRCESRANRERLERARRYRRFG